MNSKEGPKILGNILHSQNKHNSLGWDVFPLTEKIWDQFYFGPPIDHTTHKTFKFIGHVSTDTII